MFVDFTVTVEMIFSDTNTQYKIEIIPNKLISSVKSGLNFYNVFSRITNNQIFKLFKDDKLFYTYQNKIKFEEDSFDAKFLLDYFQKLKKIEHHFSVKFSNIVWEELNQNNIEKIMSYIEKKGLQVKFDGFTLKIDNKEEVNNILESCKDAGALLVSEDIKSSYVLHSLEFEIGYIHKIVDDAYVENRQEVIENRASVINLKSRSNSMTIQFTDEVNIISKQ
jgi:hypothetical protein